VGVASVAASIAAISSLEASRAGPDLNPVPHSVFQLDPIRSDDAIGVLLGAYALGTPDPPRRRRRMHLLMACSGHESCTAHPTSSMIERRSATPP
jgi:hypothetical protein